MHGNKEDRRSLMKWRKPKRTNRSKVLKNRDKGWAADPSRFCRKENRVKRDWRLLGIRYITSIMGMIKLIRIQDKIQLNHNR